MSDSKRDTEIKNRLLDSVGEGEGGMTWEKSIDMYIIIREIDRQSRFDAWDRVLRTGALGQPWGEGWDGEGGGRGVQDGEHMYTHGWFMSVYGKNHYNIVK